MGAYLSEPITKKISSDECGENVAFGASSMQGWRVSQEDAHNCCIDFDEKTSLFAVYDGHGGHEVAAYCARELPNFIKNTEAYKNGNIKQALIDAFLGFDEALTKPDIISILKEIASANNDNDKADVCSVGGGSGDEDEESVSNLRMEAAMPLEQVMAKYRLDKRVNSGGGEDEKTSSRWPMAASCSFSSSSCSWIADKRNTGGSSQACTSRASTSSNIRRITPQKVSKSANGEAAASTAAATSSNGLNDPESSEGTANRETNVGNDIDSGETLADKITSSSPRSLENGETGKQLQQDDAIGCSTPAIDAYESLLQKRKEMNRRKIRAAAVDSQVIAGIADDDDDDDDDDDEENDETFDGSSVPCCGDKTKDIDDDADDDDEDDEDNADEDDDDDEDDDEDDDKEEEEEEEDEDDDCEDGDCTMDMTEEPGSDSGCTAVVAVLHQRDLYVANAGDSRCVLCRNGQALELSLDHKPEDEPEKDRIVKAGGKVTADGRVNGGLNLSRALGDHAYKQNATLPAHEQMISALPDVRHIAIDPERDDFMILACDGIWNFMSSQEVVTFVHSRLIANADSPNVSKICEELFDHCLAPDTLGDGTGCDNMTAVIVKFNKKTDDTAAVPSSNMTISAVPTTGSDQSNLTKKRPISPSNNVPTSETCTAKTTNDSTKNEEDSKRPKIESV